MLALAIDTSQEITTIALGRDSQIIAEYTFHSKMTLLRRLLPNIERIIEDAGLQTQDIEAIIAGLGPGSFTGLRIGLTTAKSLAFVMNKPIVGVGTLDAIAKGISPVESELICPMMHARTGEVYWTIFDSKASERLEEYRVSPISEALEAVTRHSASVRFCGSGVSKNIDEIRKVFPNTKIPPLWTDLVRGAALLDLGMARLANGEADDAMSLVPMYVQKPTPVIRLESKA